MCLTFEQRFQRLDQLLLRHQALWQQRIFVEPEPRWRDDYPQLYDFLQDVSPEQLQQLQHLPTAYKTLADFIPGLQDLSDLTGLYTIEPRPLGLVDRFFHQGIPGRKWQQVQAFAQCCQPGGKRYVDWCCGKAHLGRYLHQLDQLPLLGLEYQPSLVEAGMALAKSSRDVVLQQVDVLQDSSSACLQPQDHVLALHACGDLHLQLLRNAGEQGVRGINLAPCCYQKTQAEVYQALSVQAASSQLSLSRENLHTAVQETVTAGEAVQRKRQQLQAWRLGFDCWQRHTRGVDQYLTTPTLPQSALQWGFEKFCCYLAQRRHVNIPVTTDWAHYEQLGWQRFYRTQKLDVARQVFRRAIEFWLVLDQALFLQQQAYDVTLMEFCRAELSPRNIMISARR